MSIAYVSISLMAFALSVGLSAAPAEATKAAKQDARAADLFAAPPAGFRVLAPLASSPAAATWRYTTARPGLNDLEAADDSDYSS